MSRRWTARARSLLVRVVAQTGWLAVLVGSLALITVAAWGQPWAMTLGAALVVGATLLALAWERPEYWTGRYVAAQAILIAGATALFAYRGETVQAIAALVVGLAVVLEDGVARSMPSLDARPSANLVAGDLPQRPLAGVSRVIHIALGVAVVGVVAGGAFDLTWLAVGVAMMTLIIDGGFIIALCIRSMRREAAAKRAFAAVKKLEPVFYVHWDAPSEGHYQVTMWVPYLKRLGVPFVIIVRSRRQMDALAERIDVPILLCVSGEQVERTILPSVRAVLFVNTALRNAHYLRFNGIRHIQLNHGDSDKPVSASRQFRAYDRNLVAGEAAVDRFADYGVEMPRELVRIVGRPQVESIDRPAPEAIAPKTPVVLYAPTWSGYFSDSNLSSLPYGLAMVEDLLKRGCTIIFRPHAFTSRNEDLNAEADRIRALLAGDRERTGRAHLFGAVAEAEMSVVDCFNAANAMVADVSSIVSDFLYSEKPFAMASAGVPRDEFVAAYPVSRAAYVVDADPASFHASFDAMLGADPLRSTREELRRYYLGDFPRDGYSEVFVQTLREELAITTR